MQRGIVAGTNAFRAAEGLPALAPNDALSRAAADFARYLARSGELGHTADGRQPFDRAAAAGYAACIVAENLAQQYRSDGYPAAQPLVEAFMQGWQESPGHRKNLLDPDVTQIGVGVVRDPGDRYYAVQLFGRPRDAALRFSVRNASARPIHYGAGDQSFSLAPGATRTHMLCRSVVLDLEGVSGAAATPRTGARYVVRDTGVSIER